MKLEVGRAYCLPFEHAYISLKLRALIQLNQVTKHNLKGSIRLRGDQIEMFKILNGYENIDRNIFSQSRKREGLEDMELH